MANAGLSVYTADKHLILDENYQNLRLSRKIKLTGAGTTNGTFEDGEILAAIGGLDASVSIDAYCENGSTGYTAIVKTYVEGLYIYIFSNKYEKKNSGVGLQVFNANGEVVYDSNDKSPVIIASLHNKDSGLPKDKRIAVMCGSPRKEIKSEIMNSSATRTETRLVYVPEQSHTEYETVRVPYQEAYTVPEAVTKQVVVKKWDPIQNRYVDTIEYQTVTENVTKYRTAYKYETHSKTVIDSPAHYESQLVDVTTYYVTSTVIETDKNYAISDGKIQLKEYNSKTLATKSEYSGSEEKPWNGIPGYFYHKTHPYAYNTTSDVSTFLAIDVTNL